MNYLKALLLCNLQNAIDGKMKQAQDWLVDPEALVGSAGQLDPVVSVILSSLIYQRLCDA